MISVRKLGRGPVPWLEEERLRISRSAGRDSNRIRKALKQCGIELSRTTNRIPSDFGDMLEMFRHFKLSLDRLVSKRRKPSRKFARSLLEQIRNDIYIHLDDHFKGLRRPLDQLIQELEEQGARGNKRRGRSGGRKSTRKRETFSSILAWSRRKH